MESDRVYSVEKTDSGEEQDLCAILISHVKHNSFLYDKSDRRHRDRDLLDTTWEQIACELGLTAKETKAKWTRLRNNYHKAIERRYTKLPSGSTSRIKFKQWAYEPDMDFLKNHLTTYRRTTTSSFKRSYSQSITTTSGDEDVSSDPSLYETGEPTITFTMAQDDGGNETQYYKKCAEDCYVRSQPNDGNNVSDTGSGFMQDYNNSHKRKEDPLVGWFKCFIPHLNKLSPLRLLDFQNKVTCEVKTALIEQGQEESGHHVQNTQGSEAADDDDGGDDDDDDGRNDNHKL